MASLRMGPLRIDKCEVMVCNNGMATMIHRTTFALDSDTVRRLKKLASRWQVSQAEVVRRALSQAESHPDTQPLACDAQCFVRLRRRLGLDARYRDLFQYLIHASRLSYKSCPE